VNSIGINQPSREGPNFDLVRFNRLNKELFQSDEIVKRALPEPASPRLFLPTARDVDARTTSSGSALYK
jgi:hypothetical protein